MENPRCARSLVVDDDEPNILAVLCASLRLSGFEVHAADSGARALSTVAQAAPDIVVLDVMLPDCDGFTLARQLRSAHGQLPVLFLTARDGVEDRIHTIRGGGTRRSPPGPGTLRAAAAPVRCGRLARAPHPAHLDPRVRRAVPPRRCPHACRG